MPKQSTYSLGVTFPKSSGKGSPKLEKHVKKHKKALIFSPHLDDGVLSTGGIASYLVEQGIDVMYVSVFTEGKALESQSISQILAWAEFPDSVSYFEARKTEDKKAVSLLGIQKIKHLGHIDAAWRIGVNKLPLYPKNQVGEELHAEDTLFFEEIVKSLSKQLQNEDELLVFVPLARGRHVDHVLTRNAVAKIFPNAIFYEDFPYAVLFENEHEFINENDLVLTEWVGDFRKKRDAILAYKTQHKSLSQFSNGELVLVSEKYYVPKKHLQP